MRRRRRIPWVRIVVVVILALASTLATAWVGPNLPDRFHPATLTFGPYHSEDQVLWRLSIESCRFECVYDIQLTRSPRERDVQASFLAVRPELTRDGLVRSAWFDHLVEADLRRGRRAWTWELRYAGWPLPAASGAIPDEYGNATRHGMFALRFGGPGSTTYLPLRPVWPGFIADVLFFAVLWSVPLLSLSAARSSRRRRRGRCPRCGYDLRHDLAAGCPECGWNRTPAPAS